jgi:steroid delta-isomerase-like uncharacterized protein
LLNQRLSSMPDPSPQSVVRRLFDALNAQATSQAVALLDRSYRGVDATRSVVTVGRDEAEREIQAGLDAFPSPAFSIEQCIADSSRVSVFWSLDAVHEGTFLDLPPTQQSVSISGTSFFTVRTARIVRAVHLWDLAGFLRAIRLLPDLPR